MQGLKKGARLRHQTYRIERILGQGGFGITYLAMDLSLNRLVAIKEFFPKDYCDRAGDTGHIILGRNGSAKFVSRLKAKFLKEAHNIAKLDHPGIIKIHASFEENNTAYYVMDYIKGESLSDKVKRQGALPISNALRYIKEVAVALEYIHRKHINHLDLKPANIMIRKYDDSPILIDFGLSKQYDTDGNQTSTTPTGISHGFAPLEQYNEGGVKEFSPQTDIYSLAATLYYLVSGITPPPATKLIEEGVNFPSGFPVFVRSAVKIGMSLARKNRFSSVAQFVNALDVKDESTELPTEKREIIDVPKVTTSSDVKQQPISKPNRSSSSNSEVWEYIYTGGFLVAICIASWNYFFPNLPFPITHPNKTENAENTILPDTVSKEVMKTVYPVVAEEDDNNIIQIEDIKEEPSPTISFTPSISYNTYSIGDGFVRVPNFLIYKGESDDGGPYFSDGITTLWADYAAYQDLGSFHYYVTNEIGNGSPLLDTYSGNRQSFVQSGYDFEGKIYYTKAYMHYGTLYTLTIKYPSDRKSYNDNLIPQIFNSFPNIL